TLRNMTIRARKVPWRPCFFSILVTGCFSGTALAQPAPSSVDELSRKPILGRDLYPTLWSPTTLTETPSPGRAARIRLFRMQRVLLQDLVGLESSDESPPGETSPVSESGDLDAGLGKIQLVMGSDNPFFDLRLPGDPGGVVYYRLHSQMQVMDTGSTSV